ncbi:L,D-transpeptidase [Undibacterium sp. TJN19]|uniref:L,D-transpeptidase n=1 Tax=Undibacterium sp. TJN19 TaxID=3413055 RepID=UPI003BF1E0C3
MNSRDGIRAQAGPRTAAKTAKATACLLKRQYLYLGLLLGAATLSPTAQAINSALEMKAIYADTVEQQLLPPDEEVLAYGDMMLASLANAGIKNLPPQFIVLVDRNPKVQAAMLFWLDSEGVPQLIGASPVSTGRAATGFEHFETPVGVFSHSITNLDYRAEGSKNSKGIRGYGAKGRRVFDFGWQPAKKGWGDKQIAPMRLQMHATDPDFLESRLGSMQSKGCVRIPATLNKLLDHYAVLDAEYDTSIAEGKNFWVLEKDRQENAWAGRYMVVVDSGREQRPEWSHYIARKTAKSTQITASR